VLLSVGLSRLQPTKLIKDGTYRVVYGTELDKITGSVKLSVVVWGVPVLEFLVVVGLGFG
jgi:hypothetical protein